MPGLSCELDVYEFDGYAGLTAFFDGMSEAWRGWQGERVYASLEGELTLTATHRGSQVALRVELQHRIEPGDWWATAMIDIDAGEDLAKAARDLRQLVGRG